MANTKYQALWDRVEKYTEVAEDGSLIWTGAVNGLLYPVISYRGRATYVRRAMWQEMYGEIPRGARVRSTAKNKLDVTPEKLFVKLPGKRAYEELSEEQVETIRAQFESGRNGDSQLEAVARIADRWRLPDEDVIFILFGRRAWAAI